MVRKTRLYTHRTVRDDDMGLLILGRRGSARLSGSARLDPFGASLDKGLSVAYLVPQELVKPGPRRLGPGGEAPAARPRQNGPGGTAPGGGPAARPRRTEPGGASPRQSPGSKPRQGGPGGTAPVARPRRHGPGGADRRPGPGGRGPGGTAPVGRRLKDQVGPGASLVRRSLPYSQCSSCETA